MHEILSVVCADAPPENARSEAIATVIRHLETLKSNLKDYDDRGSSDAIRGVLRETAGRLRSLSNDHLGLEIGNAACFSSAQMELIKSFVIKNITLRISPNDLAGILGMGRNRFGQMFYRSFGMTPMRFVKNARVHHAKQLLAATGMSMDEVAGQCGFPNQAHFNRVFAAESGMSPRRWRLCSKI